MNFKKNILISLGANFCMVCLFYVIFNFLDEMYFATILIGLFLPTVNIFFGGFYLGKNEKEFGIFLLLVALFIFLLANYQEIYFSLYYAFKY